MGVGLDSDSIEHQETWTTCHLTDTIVRSVQHDRMKLECCTCLSISRRSSHLSRFQIPIADHAIRHSIGHSNSAYHHPIRTLLGIHCLCTRLWSDSMGGRSQTTTHQASLPGTIEGQVAMYPTWRSPSCPSNTTCSISFHKYHRWIDDAWNAWNGMSKYFSSGRSIISGHHRPILISASHKVRRKSLGHYICGRQV